MSPYRDDYAARHAEQRAREVVGCVVFSMWVGEFLTIIGGSVLLIAAGVHWLAAIGLSAVLSHLGWWAIGLGIGIVADRIRARIMPNGINGRTR